MFHKLDILIVELLEKLMIRLHFARKTNLHHILSKHGQENRHKQLIPEGVRWAVWRRDGFTCAYCLSNEGCMTLDHIVPEALGGGSTEENLVTACRTCNSKKGTMDAGTFLESLWTWRRRDQNLRSPISITQVTQAQFHLLNTMGLTSAITGERD